MYVKLKIEGETLELLRQESESECRTPTQQCLYIIKSYYKDKAVTDSSEKELSIIENKTIVTELEQKETKVLNTVDDIIPDDILNF